MSEKIEIKGKGLEEQGFLIGKKISEILSELPLEVTMIALSLVLSNIFKTSATKLGKEKFIKGLIELTEINKTLKEKL